MSNAHVHPAFAGFCRAFSGDALRAANEPLPVVAVAADRQPAQLVRAASSFDAVIAAIEAGAERVEAAPKGAA